MRTASGREWQLHEVRSPQLAHPVGVVAARNVPYRAAANRFQNLSLYLPASPESLSWVGLPATGLPRREISAWTSGVSGVHGGAWRDPQVTSTSIEATVAHAFANPDQSQALAAVASINYTLSPFPDDRSGPPKRAPRGPSREAVHPQHLSDVLYGLGLLRTFGLTDQSYILSGHSCGACLAF